MFFLGCYLKRPAFEFDSCVMSRDELRLIRKPGSFYKTLRSYVAFFEKLILVASGSIAYLAKDFSAKDDHFGRWACELPLVWLALSVVASLAFIGFITVFYESYLNTRYNGVVDTIPTSSVSPSSYSKTKYAFILGTGWTAFVLFAAAYVLLAVSLARMTLGH